jgi:hypothetical protein
MSRKTVLEISRDVAPTINLSQPQSVFANTNGSIVKLRELMKLACVDLLAEHPWQFLQKETTLTTVADQEAYDLPALCDHLTALSFYDSTQGKRLSGSLTSTQWQAVQTAVGGNSPYKKFRLFDNKLHLSPTPSDSSTTINYEYVTSAYATSSGGTPKSEISEDSDIVLFDHILVIYATKLKWAEAQGNDTTAALADYQRALEHAKSKDVPGDVIHMGRKPSSGLISTANIPDWA